MRELERLLGSAAASAVEVSRYVIDVAVAERSSADGTVLRWRPERFLRWAELPYPSSARAIAEPHFQLAEVPWQQLHLLLAGTLEEHGLQPEHVTDGSESVVIGTNPDTGKLQIRVSVVSVLDHQRTVVGADFHLSGARLRVW